MRIAVAYVHGEVRTGPEQLYTLIKASQTLCYAPVPHAHNLPKIW